MRLNYEQKEKVVQLYGDGLSCRKIADSFGVDSSSVWGLLKRRGVVLRTQKEAQKKHDINPHAFQKPSERSCYWAGFFAADGCLYTKQKTGESGITLCLGEKDASHVYAFRDFLESSHAVIKSRRIAKGVEHYSFQISISHAEIASQLREVGLRNPNKNSLPKEDWANRDFWRGLIDGDGYLGVAEGLLRVELVAHDLMIQMFFEHIKNVIPSMKSSIRQSRGIKVISLTGKTAVELAKYLYQGSTVSLSRKYEIAKQFF